MWRIVEVIFSKNSSFGIFSIRTQFYGLWKINKFVERRWKSAFKRFSIQKDYAMDCSSFFCKKPWNFDWHFHGVKSGRVLLAIRWFNNWHDFLKYMMFCDLYWFWRFKLNQWENRYLTLYRSISQQFVLSFKEQIFVKLLKFVDYKIIPLELNFFELIP